MIQEGQGGPNSLFDADDVEANQMHSSTLPKPGQAKVQGGTFSDEDFGDDEIERITGDLPSSRVNEVNQPDVEKASDDDSEEDDGFEKRDELCGGGGNLPISGSQQSVHN